MIDNKYEFWSAGCMSACPVLLLVRELGIGGCERDLTKIAKGLDRSRFEPHVACFHSEGLRTEELRAAGVPIVRLAVHSFKSWSAVQGALQMGRYMSDHGIRLVHPFDTPTVIFGVPVARAFRIPAVLSSNLWYRNIIPPGHRWMLRLTDHMVDGIVVNSRAQHRDLVENERVQASLIRLCYNGIETNIFHPVVAPRLPVVRDAPLVVGSVCALRQEKRMDLLMRAFARVKSLLPGMKLLIVGSGETLRSLEDLRSQLDLEQDCLFEPAKKAVAEWMRTMDIFVLPSDSESFPNALLEAMACGCAVIGSRTGGIPELIKDHHSGLLFETGNLDNLTDALGALVRNSGMRRELATAAAVRAREHFSLERAVHRIQAIYNEVLG